MGMVELDQLVEPLRDQTLDLAGVSFDRQDPVDPQVGERWAPRGSPDAGRAANARRP